MKTLADEIYLSEALEALSKCFSELDLVNWDDRFASNEAYLHLPTAMIEKLEAEYKRRVAFILGSLA